MKISAIYQIVNITNGNFYIGSTSNIERRKFDHFNDLRKDKHSNLHLQNAYNKYGKENFIFQIVQYLDKDILKNIEQQYLDICVGQENCYNINKDADRGPVGIPKTEEAKRKMSLAKLGRKLSEETRLKMSIAKRGKTSNITGKKWSAESKQKLNRSGENNSRAILNEQIVRNVKQLIQQGCSNVDIGNRLGLKTYLITRIRCGKSWKHVNAQM